MKHRNSHFAVGYWSHIRRGRLVPDQADIDPKDLKRLLSLVFIVEAREGVFTYRLAGTNLCDRYGGELRGRNYLHQWDAESRVNLLPLLRQSLTGGLPVCLTSIGATEDCGMVEIEAVLMPITMGSNRTERFLGVANVLTDIAPLAGQPIARERLVSAHLVREEAMLGQELPPVVVQLPPQHAGARKPARGSHLRLVSTRERDDNIAGPGNDASSTLWGIISRRGDSKEF